MAYSAQNRAVGTVATAPSPTTSGTSVVLESGQGASFNDPASVGSYPGIIAPAGVDLWDPANSAAVEYVLITAKSTDTLTITRAQEGSSGRDVQVGDRIVAGWTAAAVIAERITAWVAAG